MVDDQIHALEEARKVVRLDVTERDAFEAFESPASTVST